MDENQISLDIVQAALCIHKSLGPGLLESVYEECMCRELSLRNLDFKRQKVIPVEYKNIKLECGFRADIVVNDLVIIERKAVENVLPIHKAQLLTYLRITGLKLGLLINFNTMIIKQGIHRVVNGMEEKI